MFSPLRPVAACVSTVQRDPPGWFSGKNTSLILWKWMYESLELKKRPEHEVHLTVWVFLLLFLLLLLLLDVCGDAMPSPFTAQTFGVRGSRPTAARGVKLWWLNKGWLTIYSTLSKKNICGEKAPSSPRKLFVSDSLMHFKNNEWGATPESHPLRHVFYC